MCNIFNCILFFFLIWGGLCVHVLRGANAAAFSFALSAGLAHCFFPGF